MVKMSKDEREAVERRKAQRAMDAEARRAAREAEKRAKKEGQHYPEDEAQRRFEALIVAACNTPPVHIPSPKWEPKDDQGDARLYDPWRE